MSRSVRSCSLCLLLLAGFLPAVFAGTPSKDPLDWPHWRGPEMNGISREKGLVGSWSLEGENLLWRSTEVSTRSTPIIMNGKVYLLSRNSPDSTKEGEKVIALDAATGNKVWENAYNIFLTDVPAERVGWSCVVGDPETGNIFSLGVCGIFQGIDGDTGKTLWQHSMSEEYGIIHTYGGRTNNPLVFEDLVIISGVMTGWGEYAVPAHRFVAFDKRNGQAVWISSTRLRPLDTTYSAPVLTTINGQKMIVFGSVARSTRCNREPAR
ncbi:MAG: PQQ-binding-like beta-propeller repeat protein [Planctomycetota bacterium]|nr:PQQ-binding-like beta-propeller repeat protein [Planctomycetota bacterium]